MPPMSKRDKLWVLLGILGFFLISYPILEIFNRDGVVMGIPVLPLYFFFFWILAIAGLYGFVRQLISEVQKGREKS